MQGVEALAYPPERDQPGKSGPTLGLQEIYFWEEQCWEGSLR